MLKKIVMLQNYDWVSTCKSFKDADAILLSQGVYYDYRENMGPRISSISLYIKEVKDVKIVIGILDTNTDTLAFWKSLPTELVF